jgi:hypothetical protein
MNRYLLFLSLLAFATANAQKLTVTIDGSGQYIKDTLLILGHRIPVRPGQITRTTFPCTAPAELTFNMCILSIPPGFWASQE